MSAAERNRHVLGGAETPQGRDDATREACDRHNITYSAYSPLGGLTKIHIFNDTTVRAIATQHNKTAAQIALRWVVQQGVPAVSASKRAEYGVSRDCKSTYHPG